MALPHSSLGSTQAL